MNKIKEYGAFAGTIFLFLLASWMLPPVVQKLMHLCPVRPDGTQEAQAMPQWARRYGVNCAMCHTSYPRLNKVGYMFRRAGFRWPDDIGKEVEIKNIGDFIAMRGRLRYEYNDSRKAGAVTKSDNGFQGSGITLYPAAGALDKTYASEFELSFEADEEVVEVENAYGKGTWGKPDLFFTLKGGIFHPFEGAGASDRPIGNFRPLFQGNAANNGQSTLFTIWGIDQLGLETGVSYKDSHLTVTVFNGINGESGKVKALEKDKDDAKDIQLLFNQFIGDGAFSLYYYNGTAIINGPVVSTATWKNSFQRFALYAYYPLFKKLDLLAGYMRGKDDAATGAENQDTQKDGIFHSEGFFLGLESIIHPHCTLTTRFDYYDPSQDKPNNTKRSLTLGLFFPFENIRYGMDYQYLYTEGAIEKVENKIKLEWQWFF